MSRTQIGSERSGYGRGLILGLTMAETMLLLVFCLLLAVGAIIGNKDKETKEAIAARQAAETALAAIESERAALDEQMKEMLASRSGATIDEEWRELRAAQQGVRKIEEAGLTLAEAVESAALTKSAREHGLQAETIADMVRAAKSAADQGMTSAEVQEITAAAEVLKKFGYDKAATAAELASILEAAGRADGRDDGPHDWPPIINLSETDGQSFASGSAELTEGFKTRLQEVAPVIAERLQEFDVDIVEVIGHTDEQAMSGTASNMDRSMREVLEGSQPVSALRPVDNAGLGLARALSVVTFLKGLPELSEATHVTFIPMSGGQLILPGDTVTDGSNSGAAAERRRIEVRVRKRINNAPEQLDTSISEEARLPFFDGVARVLTTLPN
ncbi:hypothetical protein GTW25_19905 [Aliihoeflea aestuarii]|jgi:flagellar motor protein MotB|uniref:hypothetical protein n=1 Tax=Aliihoeflea aestuarii TaxID=453840 RepID=UPI00209603FC|nr:hypothetical protein [Aliihoeflea aestuarii]MCO6393288.1 hypothetical protein [Aliihoeflea aestuarii]